MKKIGIALLIIILIGIGAYFYVFHKPHRDIAGEEAKYKLSSTELLKEYSNDQATADTLYLNQVVAISGTVAKRDTAGIMLEEGIYCNMFKGYFPEDVAVGATVHIKGRVVGYDDLFGEVRMDNCQLVEK